MVRFQSVVGAFVLQGTLAFQNGGLKAKHDMQQLQLDDWWNETLPEYCIWGPRSTEGHASKAETAWELALNETSLDPKTLSRFACNIPKLPMSWVKQIQALNHAKVHNYNFMGTAIYEMIVNMTPPAFNAAWDKAFEIDQANGGGHVFHRIAIEENARAWAIEFAKENFTDVDYFRVTDVVSNNWPWQTLGEFDHSLELGYDHSAEVMKNLNNKDALREVDARFEKDYFELMATSNFTLAPGGDRKWSMRFYEAIAAGSIPIINQMSSDMDDPFLWALREIPYKYYIASRGDEFVFRQDWVDFNMELFLKYQTFAQGDNVPPGDTSAEETGPWRFGFEPDE